MVISWSPRSKVLVVVSVQVPSLHVKTGRVSPPGRVAVTQVAGLGTPVWRFSNATALATVATAMITAARVKRIVTASHRAGQHIRRDDEASGALTVMKALHLLVLLYLSVLLFLPGSP
ncbi:hypothetical protein BDW22DRAFT_222472 [Trametopsis cervina]|nr:hypothetical protein BDW22DRAFT_222472 [Trametopsis cervina]